jgi:hypothetical protein
MILKKNKNIFYLIQLTWPSFIIYLWIFFKFKIIFCFKCNLTLIIMN